MGKSAQLLLVGDKASRQCMWEAVRDNRSGFTSRQIAKQSRQAGVSVDSYIRALNKAALIELVDDAGKFVDHRWRLIRDEGAEYPRVASNGKRSRRGLGLENLWRTLRIMGEMTAADAAEMASTGDVKVTQTYALNYFEVLVRAGYLVASEYDSQRAQTYRLAPGRGAGPRYPIVQRTEAVQVFDPNLNKVVYSNVASGGVSDASAPDNDMQQENIRLRTLLAEFIEVVPNLPSTSLLQRAQLELAE
jgi:hypothetical protein